MGLTEKRLQANVRDIYGSSFQHERFWLLRRLLFGLRKWAATPIINLAERCSPLQIALTLLLGIVAAVYGPKDPIRTVITILALILSIALVIGVKASDHTLPVKTWFIDFPAHGLAPLQGNDFMVTGGGGGLAYGVPDQSTICRLANSQVEKVGGLPLNLFAQYNEQYYPDLAATLKACELLMGESLPASVIWAISSYAPRMLVAGGIGGKLVIYRQRSIDYNNVVDLVASHEIIRQSVKNKRRVLLSRTRFSSSGEYLCVLTEDNRILIYSVPTFDDDDSNLSQTCQEFNQVRNLWQTKDVLILLGQVQVSEKEVGCLVDVQITDDQQWIIALTTSGNLLWLRIPNPLLGVHPSNYRGHFRLSRPADPSTPSLLSLADTETLKVKSASQLPHSNDFYHRHLLCLKPNQPHGKQPIYRVVSFGIFRQHGYSTTAAGFLVGEWMSESTGTVPIGRRDGMRPRRIAGLDCVSACALSLKGDQIACISNSRIVTIDSKSFRVTRQIRRFDIASDEASLPSTSVCWIGEDRYIVVGGADYSLSVVALHGYKSSTSTTLSRWYKRIISDSSSHTINKSRDLAAMTIIWSTACAIISRLI